MIWKLLFISGMTVREICLTSFLCGLKIGVKEYVHLSSFFLTHYPGGKILSKKRRRDDSDGGSAIGFWLVVGVGAGVAIGVALNSIPVGIAVGAGLGFLLGAAIDQQRR